MASPSLASLRTGELKGAAADRQSRIGLRRSPFAGDRRGATGAPAVAGPVVLKVAF